jgi:hypothetical protein
MANKYDRHWIIYILHLVAMVLINCALSLCSLVEVSLAIKIFIISAFLPSPIYLLESVATRGAYVDMFNEIECINATLSRTQRERVLQLSTRSIAKIIFVLVMLVAQLAFIAVQCFIFSTLDLNVQVP